MFLTAKVALPGCNGSDSELSFSYVWELRDSSGNVADLGRDTDLSKPYLRLDGSNLNGDEVCKPSNFKITSI